MNILNFNNNNDNNSTSSIFIMTILRPLCNMGKYCD